jgi:hypothetical protein
VGVRAAVVGDAGFRGRSRCREAELNGDGQYSRMTFRTIGSERSGLEFCELGGIESNRFPSVGAHACSGQTGGHQDEACLALLTKYPKHIDFSEIRAFVCGFTAERNRRGIALPTFQWFTSPGVDVFVRAVESRIPRGRAFAAGKTSPSQR